MSDDNPTAEYQSGDLVVLFADIVGSTKIYEEFGDTIARDATSDCITIMTDVAARLQGRVVLEELLVRFPDFVVDLDDMEFATGNYVRRPLNLCFSPR